MKLNYIAILLIVAATSTMADNTQNTIEDQNGNLTMMPKTPGKMSNQAMPPTGPQSMADEKDADSDDQSQSAPAQEQPPAPAPDSTMMNPAVGAKANMPPTPDPFAVPTPPDTNR